MSRSLWLTQKGVGNGGLGAEDVRKKTKSFVFCTLFCTFVAIINKLIIGKDLKE